MDEEGPKVHVPEVIIVSAGFLLLEVVDEFPILGAAASFLITQLYLTLRGMKSTFRNIMIAVNSGEVVLSAFGFGIIPARLLAYWISVGITDHPEVLGMAGTAVTAVATGGAGAAGKAAASTARQGTAQGAKGVARAEVAREEASAAGAAKERTRGGVRAGSATGARQEGQAPDSAASEGRQFQAELYRQYVDVGAQEAAKIFETPMAQPVAELDDQNNVVSLVSYREAREKRRQAQRGQGPSAGERKIA
jgi:hypothetical protein